MVVVQVQANVVNGDIENKEHAHGKTVKSKNQLRRLKQKQKKQTVCWPFARVVLVYSPIVTLQQEKGKGDSSARGRSDELENMEVETGQVEYVAEQLDLSEAGLEAFSDVFARFQLPPEESSVRIAYYVFLSRLTFFRIDSAGQNVRSDE